MPAGDQRPFLRPPGGTDERAPGGPGQVDLTRAVTAVAPRPTAPATVERDSPDEEPGGTGVAALRRRLAGAARTRRGRIVLVAVAVAVILAVVATVILSMVAGSTTPTAAPAAVPDQGSAAPAASSVAGEPTPGVDPAAPAATAFLKALQRVAVPVSPSGLAETEAAAVICAQLAAGTDRQTLVEEVPALLPTVPEGRAGDVVAAASKTYC